MKDLFIYSLIIVNIFVLINLNLSNSSNSSIVVEVKGAVNNPGVYYLKEESTVNDLIIMASGLTNNSNTTVNNLAHRLKDEDVVIIYTNDEINEMMKGSTSVKYIDKECICPRIDNASFYKKMISNIDGVIINTGKISLNSASIKELMTLPGIGESKAKLIILYRDQNNGFKSIEEIKNVKGIGNSIYEKFKDYLTL